jgi:hypothetical protein
VFGDAPLDTVNPGACCISLWDRSFALSMLNTHDRAKFQKSSTLDPLQAIAIELFRSESDSFAKLKIKEKSAAPGIFRFGSTKKSYQNYVQNS